jgi:adenosylmethionine-8-amino-7-oxononanoate aminotransferase
MFACQNEAVTPDIMCLAKGITAGYLPLAATLVTPEVFGGFTGPANRRGTFYHGHTYTGNALGCAAAIASLKLFEKNRVLENMPPKIDIMHVAFGRIASLPFVGDARHRGLMGAVEIVRNRETAESFDPKMRVGARLCEKMRPKGLILRPLGDCIIVMPPPAIEAWLLERLLEIVFDTIANDLEAIVDGRP